MFGHSQLFFQVLKKSRDATIARKTRTAQKEKSSSIASKRPNEPEMNLKNVESPPKTCEVTSKKTSAGNGNSKKGAKKFSYEIDCTRVKDTVNVDNLVRIRTRYFVCGYTV